MRTIVTLSIASWTAASWLALAAPARAIPGQTLPAFARWATGRTLLAGLSRTTDELSGLPAYALRTSDRGIIWDFRARTDGRAILSETLAIGDGVRRPGSVPIRHDGTGYGFLFFRSLYGDAIATDFVQSKILGSVVDTHSHVTTLLPRPPIRLRNRVRRDRRRDAGDDGTRSRAAGSLQHASGRVRRVKRRTLFGRDDDIFGTTIAPMENRFMNLRTAAATLAAAGTLVAPTSSPATPVAPLSPKAPVFSAGHWIGKGWFTATHSDSTADSISDGQFTFDLTVGVSGIVVGRMMMSTTGSVTNAAAIATFTETSDGTGWVLSGNAASVVWGGSESVQGKMTGRRNGITIPLPVVQHFQASGHFEPLRATCNTASGNISLPLQKAFASGRNATNTTISGPWVAMKVESSPGLHDPSDQIEGWSNTIEAMDKAADDDFKDLTTAELRTLISQAEQVEAAIHGFLKCGSGAPGLNSKSSKDTFYIFGLEIASAKAALASR